MKTLKSIFVITLMLSFEAAFGYCGGVIYGQSSEFSVRFPGACDENEGKIVVTEFTADKDGDHFEKSYPPVPFSEECEQKNDGSISCRKRRENHPCWGDVQNH